MGSLSRDDYDDAKKDWAKQDKIWLGTLQIRLRNSEAAYNELPADADPEVREGLYQDMESIKTQIRMVKRGIR